MKYLRFTPSCCRDIWIRKLKFVTKTQFSLTNILLKYYNCNVVCHRGGFQPNFYRHTTKKKKWWKSTFLGKSKSIFLGGYSVLKKNCLLVYFISQNFLFEKTVFRRFMRGYSPCFLSYFWGINIQTSSLILERTLGILTGTFYNIYIILNLGNSILKITNNKGWWKRTGLSTTERNFSVFILTFIFTSSCKLISIFAKSYTFMIYLQCVSLNMTFF